MRRPWEGGGRVKPPFFPVSPLLPQLSLFSPLPLFHPPLKTTSGSKRPTTLSSSPLYHFSFPFCCSTASSYLALAGDHQFHRRRGISIALYSVSDPFVWFSCRSLTVLSPMLPVNRSRNQPRAGRSWLFSGMDYSDSRHKPHFLGKVLMAAILTALCIFILKQSPGFSGDSMFSRHEPGVTHVLVTGGAGYIGSHAALRLLKDSYRVTIVDNLSRGNIGAIKVLQELFPETGRLQFIYADLGDAKAVNQIFAQNAFDAVMHFAAVAYVGESTLEPLRYYHNITANTLVILEAMAAHGVKTLIYSSTCATYGEPEKMPITEETPQFPINPYGKAKKMAEDIILDFSKNADMAVMILRYFNVIGSDPEGRLGEAPRPELREHGRISGACFDAALGIIPGLKVKGADYPTADGTCVRDYIDVTDLVDAHVKALDMARPNKVSIYNVGTGKGRSVKEFVEACKKATGANIKVEYLDRRPGDYAEVYSDPSKINRELNWTAQYTDLQESLSIAWKWQKSHRNGYGSPSVMTA